MQIDVSEYAAEHRPDDEPHAECRTDFSKTFCPIFRRRHVGCISTRHRHARRRHATDHAADKQCQQRWCPSGGEKIKKHADHRVQQHRTAANLIAHRAQDRHEQKLQQAKNGGKNAVPVGLQIAPLDKFADQYRQHRDRETDTEHVDEHADENEIQAT